MTQFPALPTSTTAALEPVKYISVTDTAKLVRQALNEAFPEVKFSVRSMSYAGGASINVRWVDGPTTKLVDRIVKPFAGAGFDSMRDLKFSLYQSMNGRMVHFGANFVHTQRVVSKERLDALEAEIAKADKADWLTIASKAGHSRPCAAVDYAVNACDLAWSILADVCDEKWLGRSSATAESVEYLGDTHQNPPV